MVRINLLPVRVSKKKEAGKQQLVLFAVLLVAGLVFNAMWHRNRFAALESLETRVARTRTEIANLDRILGEVKTIRTQQEELKTKLAVLDKLKEGRTGPVRMLDELASITPKRLWLRKLEEKSGKITFSGTAATIDDVSQFMGALKQSKYFADVELKKTEGKTQGTFRVVEFTIQARAKYAPGIEAAEAGAKAAPKGGKAGG